MKPCIVACHLVPFICRLVPGLGQFIKHLSHAIEEMCAPFRLLGPKQTASSGFLLQTYANAFPSETPWLESEYVSCEPPHLCLLDSARVAVVTLPEKMVHPCHACQKQLNVSSTLWTLLLRNPPSPSSTSLVFS